MIILLFGFFKIWLCRIFTIPVSSVLEMFGYHPGELLDNLNAFSRAVDYKDFYLGWVIYYPAYLLFHLIFISILFYKKKKIRNRLSVILVITVLTLFVFAVVSNVIGLKNIYEVSYSLFQSLFSLPFILLTIEGGRVFMKDIERLTVKVKE